MNTENLLLQRQCLGNHVTTSARGRDILLPSATTVSVRCVVSGHPKAGTRGSAVCTRYLHAYTVSEMREAHREERGDYSKHQEAQDGEYRAQGKGKDSAIQLVQIT